VPTQVTHENANKEELHLSKPNSNGLLADLLGMAS
jgi:hypothetical protein